MSFDRRAPSASLFVLLALAAGAGVAHAQEDASGNVTITDVTLATGGLAEVTGRVTAPSDTMRLAIERSQVADVLRTLVVTGTTPVVSIDLEAAEPVGERSSAGRLLAGDLADPMTMLEALIGETVTVRGGSNVLAGRLLAYTPVAIPAETEGSDAIPGLRIAVATADGPVAFATFPTLSSITIEGAAVDARMAEVVPALSETVDDGRRELSVTLAEEASPGFSFVVPTTVWRPSYRAVIGDGDASLQGWATLENTTGFDWEGVRLRLSVGTPVAYRQDVYSPLRTQRPEAPFTVGRTAEAPIVLEELEASGQFVAPSAAPAREMAMADMAPRSRMAPAPAPAPVATGAAPVSGSASTVFEIAGAIDLDAGRTLTVPFLSGTEAVEKVAYLDLAARAETMDALELTFDAQASVPGGLIAVYDAQGFVGDARFAGADGGATTLLPFALSADVDVRITSDTSELLASASLADGALRLRRERQSTLSLAVRADEAVALVADDARGSAETVTVTGPQDGAARIVRLDAATVRLRADVPAGDSTIVLTAVRPFVERIVVSDIPTRLIEEVLSLGGVVDAQTRERLQKIAAINARIAEIDRRLATLEANAADLRDAVAADRENIEAIDPTTPEGAAVRERIIERTNAIDAMLSEMRDLRAERLTEEAALR